MKMKKLQMKNTELNKTPLVNGTKHNIGDLAFDLSQFQIPKDFVMLKNEMTVKADREQNKLGELVETGTYTVTFKVYDRLLVENALTNDLPSYGSPIDVVIEKIDKIPDLDKFVEIDFISIKFDDLVVKPARVERKVYHNGQAISSWQFADVKVVVSGYSLED